MKLTKIRLSSFRNFNSKLISFSPKTTVIIGPNASGKSNIFEAIYLLASGKSFRAKIEEEMINYSKELSRVKGRIISENDSGYKDLEIVLTRGQISIGDTDKKYEKVARKRLLVNGVGKRLIDFAGNFKVVLFGPWDLELVTESPTKRRKFLDSVLSQVNREYRRASLSYDKGLRQRNKLLLRIREEGLSRSQLLFWDKLLIRNGDYVSKIRGEFIDFANESDGFAGQEFLLEYDKSAISETRLEQYASEEVAAATTLVGPHRDDFCFRIKGKNGKSRDLSRYGSRGEQRMAVLWLKLIELSFFKQKSGEEPTLLLDDIFSELDEDHRGVVFDISKNQQTIITTADPHFVKGLKNIEIIKLKG